jgi:hypothetical protein
MSTDPSSGLYSIHINPASTAFYPYSYQVNISAGHFFGETNYAAVSNTSLLGLLSNYNDVDIATSPNQINDGGNNSQLVFGENGGRRYGAVSATYKWPSLLWTKDKITKMGVFAQSRLEGSFFRLPEVLGYYEMAAVSFSPTTIGPFSAGYLSWTEVGFHASKRIVEDNYQSSSFGFNGKFLLPHESGRFEMTDELFFNRENNLYTGEGLHSSSQYTFFESGSFRPRITGMGLGFDLGYMSANEDQSYGFSILDLGFVRISGEAEAFDIVSDTTIFYDNSGLTNPGDLDEVVNDLDAQLDPQISRLVDEKSSYYKGLPTALSFQYYRKLNPSWSLSAVVVQRFPVFANSVRRPNMVSVIPRFKKDLFHLSFPISLFEYKSPAVGMTLKYWFLFVGTDNLLSHVPQNRFSGSDFYFGLQWFPFKENRKDTKVRCFSF